MWSPSLRRRRVTGRGRLMKKVSEPGSAKTSAAQKKPPAKLPSPKAAKRWPETVASSARIC